jgi:hypothetical protein
MSRCMRAWIRQVGSRVTTSRRGRIHHLTLLCLFASSLQLENWICDKLLRVGTSMLVSTYNVRKMTQTVKHTSTTFNYNHNLCITLPAPSMFHNVSISWHCYPKLHFQLHTPKNPKKIISSTTTTPPLPSCIRKTPLVDMQKKGLAGNRTRDHSQHRLRVFKNAVRRSP